MAAPRVIRVQYEVNNNEVKASADLWRQVARELGHSEAEADALADDFKRAGEEAKRSGKAINQTANDARKAGTSIGSLAKQVAGVLSVAALAAAGREIVKQAGRIEATAKKVTAVFGAAAGSINTFAASMTDSLGISEEGIKSITASIGDLLIPMGFTEQQAASMSTELTSLSAALSDWSGGQMDAAEVGDVLAKAMLGEREALKSLGISITEADVQQRLLEKGQKSLTGTALQQAKAIATQELIFEKSASAQAAFAANTDGVNKTLSKMGAAFSNLANTAIKAFLPQIQSVISGVESLTSGIMSWFGVTNNVTDAYDDQLVSLKQNQAQLNALAPLLADETVKQEQKEVIMAKIQTIYPGFLKNMDLQKLSENQLRDALAEANKEFEKRGELIILQKAQAQIQEQNAGASLAGANALIALKDAIDNQLGGWRTYNAVVGQVGETSADFTKNFILFTDNLKAANLPMDQQVFQLKRFIERYKEAKPELIENNQYLSDQIARISGLIRIYEQSGVAIEKSAQQTADLQRAADALGVSLTNEATTANTAASALLNQASAAQEADEAQRKRSEELAKARQKAAEAAREELESLQTLKMESFATAAAQEQLYLNLVEGAGAFGDIITRDMVTPISEDLPGAMRKAEGDIMDAIDKIANYADDRSGLNLMEQLGFTQEHVNAAVALADGLFSTIASLSQAYGAQETARLDEQMRRELERNDKTTKDQEQRAKNREKIEERFAKKKAAIDRDIAEQERRYAIFQAIINTAQAFTKALATFPPPISYIQAGIAAASGLAQVRLIEAQAFADGGEVKGGTPGKDSVPAMLMPNEFVMTVDNMRKHGDLIRAIHKDRLPEYFGQNTTYHVNENGQLVAEIKSLKKAIQAKREVTFRGEVFEKALFERRGRAEYLNRKYSSRK